MKVIELEFGSFGFAHTPLGTMYKVHREEEDLWVAAVIEGSCTTKSAHPNQEAAQTWCQGKFEEAVKKCFVDAD